jgi:solute carrier family 50 protein (sugar transporter)
MSILPFLSLFTNCIVWTTYGLLANDMTVIAPNATGILTGMCQCLYSFPVALLLSLSTSPLMISNLFQMSCVACNSGAYYTYVFSKYHPSSLVKHYLISASIIGATSTMALTLPLADAQTYIGWTGCTLAVILMSSPLATVATVIKEKSTASMPFFMSLVRIHNVH